MAFTESQQTQVNRFSADRRAQLTPAKLERYTPEQLRARVNIRSVSSSGVIQWSPENDYTAAEMEAIAEGSQQGGKWMFKAAEIVAAGLSLKQRIVILEKSVKEQDARSAS